MRSLYCIVLYRFCHFWHTSFWPTSTSIPSPLPSDRIDALTIIILTLFNPVNEDFRPFALTLPRHWCTILPKATYRPAAAVTRAAWGGVKPGHISAFPGYACETTAIGRQQPNRIHTDGFCFRPWRDANPYGSGMWPVVQTLNHSAMFCVLTGSGSISLCSMLKASTSGNPSILCIEMFRYLVILLSAMFSSVLLKFRPLTSRTTTVRYRWGIIFHFK